MTIQNMFNMAKGQTLTQDGCEADVDDKRYNIGDISQKTGLQKTANGWVKPKNGKQAGAKTGPGESPKESGPLNPAKRKAERIAKMQKETGKAAPYGRTLKGTPKTPDDNPLTERTQARSESRSGWKPDESAHLSHKDHVSLAKEVKSNSLPGSDWTAEEIAKEWKLGKGDAEEVKKEFDKIKTGSKPAAKRDTDPQTYMVKKNDELRVMFQKEKNPAKKAAMKKALQKQASMMKNEPFTPGEDAESKPAPQKKSQPVKSVKEYLSNNFWSQPEDFKDDMSDAGWDVDEMTNEYAVISNEAGSQYEVRFADHGDGRDLTMKSFKALQIDEDDDDSLEDCAPRVLTKDTKIRVRKA